MAAALPAGPPPPHLWDKALPYLAARIAAASVDGPTAVQPVLQLALSTLAAARLAGTRVTVPLAPLHAFASLAAEDPDSVSLPLLCDALLAYPVEVAVLTPAVAAKVYELPELIDALVGRLKTTPSANSLLATSRLLHALLRAHDEGAALLIESAESLVPAIGHCYDVIGSDKDATGAKAEALTFVRALAHLAGPGAAALRNLVGGRSGGAPLVDGAMADDFDLFNDAHLGDKEAAIVRDLHDEERSDDPRLGPLRHLFPSLPQHLLVDALAHPQFAAAGSRATVDEQAAPLVEAILSGTLPIELSELRAAAASISADREAEDAKPEKIERRNVFNDEPLDLSRIRIKGHTDPVVGTEISNNLRASIKRLVLAQAEEEEAAARAVADAHGTVYRPPGGYEDDDDSEDDLPAARLKLADGDESGASDDDDRTDRSSSPEPPSRSSNTKASQPQAILELAYVRNPSVFNRDAATRRSTARTDLRNATGMDDSQLEGWKIMLERNPHKDAILERHQYARPSSARDTPNHGKKDGGGGGGGRGQNSGGGGSSGGRGGNNNSGGGGRGGRGGNKGSRGHSNAARTRGNDRKMARMGAGL